MDAARIAPLCWCVHCGQNDNTLINFGRTLHCNVCGHEALRSAIEDAAGVRRVNLGQPSPIGNCRNCGAAPEASRPRACGWCLTPR